MHTALYRKWRPQVFDDVCGQEHITSILKYETANNKFSHAYLFCGSRGTGKTTCAKILAKAINCEHPQNGSPCGECASCRAIDSGAATDVLEMDAASNNGVDDIRDIRDEVVYMPNSLKYRVYIVDEVHMLSGSAFNALLKTLEEPPSHVVFILATTELHKLPATIVSRCQRFDFRRISTQVLIDRLAYICEQEGISFENDALRSIAKTAQGGMRDAISLLELCAGTQNRVDMQTVNDTLGFGGRDNVEGIVTAIANGDYDGIFNSVSDIVSSSKDIGIFWQELMSYYRDMLVMKTTAKAEKYLDLTENESERLKKNCELFSKQTLVWHCKVLDETLLSMQRAGAARQTLAEMALIKMSDSMLDTSTDALLTRIAKLEAQVASGAAVKAVADAAPNKAAEVKSAAVAEKATVKNTTRTAASRTSQTASASELKLIRGWSDIAEAASAGDASITPFLKMAKAFKCDDGGVCIKLPNTFALNMINQPDVVANIKAALSARLDIKPQRIDFDVFGADETINDLDGLNL